MSQLIKVSTCLFLLLLLVMFSSLSSAAEDETKTNEEQTWAVGAIFRTASIPFATEEGKVATFIPLISFENDRFFFRALEGGVKVYKRGDWRLSALGRLRFLDIPADYQNQIQGDTMDFGVQVRYQPFGLAYLDLEMMSDWDGRTHYNARVSIDYSQARFHFRPFAELRYKNSSFNTHYFGLNQEDVDAGMDLGLGVVADYNLTSNLYIMGAAQFTHLDSNVRGASIIDSKWHNQGFLGVGFSNDKSKPRKGELGNRPYLRLAHGWATPSSLQHIIHFNADDDPYNNQLTSVFYGYPLTDSLLGLPIDMYLHSGFVWHWKSSVQQHAQEVVLAIKLFHTIKWPVRWRLGAAEGLSYVNEIPYVERTQLGKKGYEPSNLLNFLDISLDINIGDIAGSDTLRRYWLGYSIHHRSAIFETAQQFGRIKGGSNFQSVFLKRHF